MKREEFLNLSNGQYELTDGIYQYTLTVGVNDKKSKYFRIQEKTSPIHGGSIYITQETDTDDYGEPFTYLSAIAGVGGLHIYSTETHELISRLKIVEP